jgi:uncharacterized protein (DUF2132 family)
MFNTNKKLKFMINFTHNMEQISKDPLHGKRLDAILEELLDYYNGFEELGRQININCFTDNPSINSSLKFLRKTDWARAKVESLYLYVLRQKKKNL